MFGGLQRQLRYCLLAVVSFLALQFLLVLLLMHYGLFEDTLTKRLTLNHEQLSLDLELGWRDFVALTPKRTKDLYQYNQNLSDKYGPLRALPTVQHDSCNKRTYTLPHASRARISVIISYYNEARSVLLRTLVSLIKRTPEDYLHELVVIDDYSDDELLLQSLNEILGHIYATRGQLTFVFKRNLHRKGLIQSRNDGAQAATGNYLFFLDSHCEVNEGWLEPLLDRLIQNPQMAVSPLLDAIDPASLEYTSGNALLKGGFDWSLHFHWLPRVLEKQESEAQEYRSPSFSGGVFMISRDWFLKLRGFNTQLQTWGGESIELAVKLWLCGGQIEIVPCSRIGHIFRPRHAFEFPSQLDAALDTAQATYLRNSKIIAESWLDEYKYLFYALKPAAKQIPLNLADQLHNVEQLKQELQCKPFAWFLRYVCPELKLQHAEFSAVGTLRNGERCLHVAQIFPELQLLLVSCYQQDLTQWRLHRESGQLSTESKRCLGVVLQLPLKPRLTLEPCMSTSGATEHDWAHSQRWLRRKTQLLHASSQLCVDNPIIDRVELSTCRPFAISQAFHFSLEIEAQR
ncbi:putative polypeptide N-acetylgalactosaminyltransferase 13 [Drosophila busckii]|uniref:putative polypeptide N-acetylgalactosaminyltransferase 13 n=1 Tax=Drosophila busckii TaxID=30019 RepID=UPI00083F4721|nr:putative polypeptide N-acetylgalactosaminyltransferase 13 [Drosophila busckii]